MDSLINWFKSWKLVSWRTAIVAVIFIYGLVGFFLVPVVAKKVIVHQIQERTGREATVGEVRCNPFTLSLRIRGFSFPDRPGSVFLSFDEFYANAQVSSLFRWAATLKELRVENPYVGVRRFEDGGINVLELMDDIEERTPPDEEPDEEGGLPRALLQYILVANASLDIEDRAIPEPVLLKLGPSKLELHDISTIPDGQGTNDFVIGLQRGGKISVTGNVVVDPFGLDGTVTVDNIFLEDIWPVIKHKFEFDLVSGNAGGKLRYAVQIRDDGLNATIDALRAQNMTTDEGAGEQVLDETAYYRDLRVALIEAQPVATAAVQALGEARAEAVRAFLVDGTGADPARIRIIEPVAVEESEGEDDWVRCRLDVDTGG